MTIDSTSQSAQSAVCYEDDGAPNVPNSSPDLRNASGAEIQDHIRLVTAAQNASSDPKEQERLSRDIENTRQAASARAASDKQGIAQVRGGIKSLEQRVVASNQLRDSTSSWITGPTHFYGGSWEPMKISDFADANILLTQAGKALENDNLPDAEELIGQSFKQYSSLENRFDEYEQGIQRGGQRVIGGLEVAKVAGQLAASRVPGLGRVYNAVQNAAEIASKDAFGVPVDPMQRLDALQNGFAATSAADEVQAGRNQRLRRQAGYRETVVDSIREQVESGIRKPETELLARDRGAEVPVDIAEGNATLGESQVDAHHKTSVAEAPELAADEANLEPLDSQGRASAHAQGAHGNNYRVQRSGLAADPDFQENTGMSFDRRRLVDSETGQTVSRLGQSPEKNLTVEEQSGITARPRELTDQDILDQNAIDPRDELIDRIDRSRGFDDYDPD